MPDLIPSFVPAWRDLLWRIVVTILLLLVLVGSGAKPLRRLAMYPAWPIVPVVRTLLLAPF